MSNTYKVNDIESFPSNNFDETDLIGTPYTDRICSSTGINKKEVTISIQSIDYLKMRPNLLTRT